jgi:hypothetical protein
MNLSHVNMKEVEDVLNSLKTIVLAPYKMGFD